MKMWAPMVEKKREMRKIVKKGGEILCHLAQNAR
jgi:hypothetical protein